MNVSELQSVQARERQSDSLQELRPSFYQDAADFVTELREERAGVAADVEDPFEDPEVTRLTDDIRTAEGTIEAIYERRVGKIVKLASLAASDMPAEEDGLTTEERELYETLVDAIESHREAVLSTVREGTSTEILPTNSSQAAGDDRSAPDRPADEGTATAGPNAATGGDSQDIDRSPGEENQESDGTVEFNGGRRADEAASRPGPDDQPSAAGRAVETVRRGPDESETERTTVRITEDVGAILGVDEREYDLATDDVVTLPAENAAPLIERDAAEPIE